MAVWIRGGSIVAAGLAMVAVAASGARGGVQYKLTIIDVPGAAHSMGYGVNDVGQVSGTFSTSSDGDYQRAFVTGPQGGPGKVLDTLGGDNAYGFGVNASGQVAGGSDLSSPGANAFLSAPGGGPLKDLGTLPGGSSISIGSAVNDAGQVAGTSNVSGGDSHAFLSGPDGGSLKDLGTLGGSDSNALGVNAMGQVAGYSDVAGPGFTTQHAFFYDGGGGPLKDLGTLGGSFSTGTAVDILGEVAGYSQTSSDSPQHAFLSGADGGPLKDLGTLANTDDSRAFGVNASGQVVGVSGEADHSRAFLYRDGSMVDLNALIDPSSGFTLMVARSISDGGYIAGYGYSSYGEERAFLLTPVPEPSSIALLAISALALAVHGGLRGARRRKAA